MITPQQAEALANKTIEDYVNACGCRNEQDVANVLMKLASMSGLGMCAVVGQLEAGRRMRDTAEYIATSKIGTGWKRETVQ